MATKYPFEEHTRVTWAPTVTHLAQPNTVELNAGTLLTCHLTKDGLNPGGSTNGIDSGALCSRIDGQVAGSVSFSATLKFFRYEQGDDDAWDLVNWGDAGYLVIRRGLAYDTIWGVGQAVEVYKAQLQGEQTKAEINNALVQRYKAQIEGSMAQVEIYKAEVGAASVLVQLEQNKLQAAGAQFREPVVASSAANTLTTFEGSLFVEDAEQKATVGASS